MKSLPEKWDSDEIPDNLVRVSRGELKKLDRTVAKRIYKKVSQLCENPYHFDVTKMVGDPYFRLRVGDYRIVFDIQNDLLRILVLKVGHRKNVYKK